MDGIFTDETYKTRIELRSLHTRIVTLPKCRQQMSYWARRTIWWNFGQEW